MRGNLPRPTRTDQVLDRPHEREARASIVLIEREVIDLEDVINGHERDSFWSEFATAQI